MRTTAATNVHGPSGGSSGTVTVIGSHQSTKYTYNLIKRMIDFKEIQAGAELCQAQTSLS